MSRIFTEKRKDKITVVVLLSLIVFLYAAALMQARTSYSVLPALTEYREDINRDGLIDQSDVISLIILGRNIPDSPMADYNGDSVFNVLDAITLLLNIRDSRLTLLLPVDTSGTDTTVTDTTATDTTVTDTTVTDTTATDTTGNQAVYTISGYVYCLASRMANIGITLTGDAETSTFTDASGFYSFQVTNGRYIIIPAEIASYGYSPPMRVLTVEGASLQRLDFLVFGFDG